MSDVHGVVEERVWIGTSGWTYDSWRGPFFPKDIPKQRWLSWYASQFTTTEINNSFYRTPSLETVRTWRQSTPSSFKFAWKASKFITHWKRLNAKTCGNSIDLMVTRLRAFGPKVGPVLFQLPGNFESDPDRLAAFLLLLPRHYPYAFEFRHPSWYEKGALKLLREHNVALCLSDHHHAPAPWLATASHVYVRGHGPDGRYRRHYPDQTLKTWARDIRKWNRQGKTVYVYFDNDQKSAAPTDARRLQSLLATEQVPSAKRFAHA
jgi:uncharacterized protein YecE (DUF72 family)